MHNNKIVSQFLHFDSISSNNINDPNNTSTNTSNCYKASFPLTTSFKKIKKVSLKSIEMTIGFPNIRTGSTDTFKFYLNGTLKTATLSENNYTSITTLCSALTTACTVASGLTSMTFSQIGTTSKVQLTLIGSFTTFSIVDTNLSKYILGFRSTDPVISSIVSASNNYTLAPDNYLNIYMPNLASYNANQTGSWSTFKLPLNSVTGNVYYYQDNSSFEQFVDITDDNFVLSNLIVIIYDRFGNNINPYGLDYSFTLRLDYEK